MWLMPHRSRSTSTGWLSPATVSVRAAGGAPDTRTKLEIAIRKTTRSIVLRMDRNANMTAHQPHAYGGSRDAPLCRCLRCIHLCGSADLRDDTNAGSTAENRAARPAAQEESAAETGRAVARSRRAQAAPQGGRRAAAVQEHRSSGVHAHRPVQHDQQGSQSREHETV